MNNKDWTGNGNSIFKTLGASAHTDEEREQNDYYATEPYAIDVLLEVESFYGNIWECACGEGHLAKQLQEHKYQVIATDLYDRGYGQGGVDFLEATQSLGNNIITNPPYKYAQEFVEKAIEILPDYGKVAMFLKIQFLEGKKRKEMFKKFPPNYIYVSSSRLLCAKNGDFEYMRSHGGSAVAYAWYVWYKGHVGDTIIKWTN
jgi:hypothetical protein